jgi:hypothetical protein
MLVVSSVLILACSRGDSSSAGGGNPGDKPGVDVDSGTGTTSADLKCGGLSTYVGCYSCCKGNHEDAYLAWAETGRSCYCAAGNCDKACATSLCATPRTGVTENCQACLIKAERGACHVAPEAYAVSAAAPLYKCIVDQSCLKKQ